MSADNVSRPPRGDILVVEDNTSDLKFISEILTKDGYRVRPAGDSALALRSVQAKQPDLILLDINLPGITGVEMCRRLKSNPETRGLPVIFISALTETDLKVKALEAGGTDYVTKPIEASEVLARINTHLNIHRLQRRLAVKSEELSAEIEERKRAEAALQRAHDQLEVRVEERTAALAKANKLLHSEVAERKQAEEALQKLNIELEERNQQLQKALGMVKQLSGLLPICMHCKKIRDDEGYWEDVAVYVSNHSEADFSHGICPDCKKKFYSDFFAT